MKNMNNMKKQLENLLKYNASLTVEEKKIYEIIKRIFDILFMILISPFALVIIVIFGILVKIDSPGPIFYRQSRCGLNGRIFTITKIRSMEIGAEKNGAQWATKNDPRITRMGKIIRKTRIDELPQLINVLVGDLSFVGPRPERPELTIQFSEDIPNFIERVLVKPGLTGLAQINGGYEMDAEEKLVYDVKYIKMRSLWLDLKILFFTVWVVISGHGAY